jgi:hypothetical protein
MMMMDLCNMTRSAALQQEETRTNTVYCVLVERSNAHLLQHLSLSPNQIEREDRG